MAAPGAKAARTVPARPLGALARDPQLWLAVVAGPAVWLAAGIGGYALFDPAGAAGRIAAAPGRFALAVVAYPIVEELLFRGLLQPAIAARTSLRALPGVTAANFHASLAFALTHLFYHPPPQALATFFPSLVFGHFRERYGSVVPGIVLHAWYNLGWLALLGQR